MNRRHVRIKPPRRDERGAALSIPAAILVPGLLVMVGLVVDGGGKIEAARRADAAAYSAVRYGGEAAATDVAAGATPTTSVAAQAARSYLARSRVTGTVTAQGRRLTVTTTATYSTIFLNVIGVNQLTGHGEADALITGVR